MNRPQKQQSINRISVRLNSIKERNEKALACFLTAGFPERDVTVQLAKEIELAGADLIELGMPFSDPLADGPIIQASSQQAIKNGITLEHIFEQVREIRMHSNIPLVLMGYLNPILHYGENGFYADAASSGVDGIILPELPLEESQRYCKLTEKHSLANILLVSPTTPDKRIQAIDEVSSGFLYCVSTTGVTGRSSTGDVESYVKRVKRNAKRNPVLVGFGIKTPADAQRLAHHADGVIVGSELIRRVRQGDSTQEVGNYVKQLKIGLNMA